MWVKGGIRGKRELRGEDRRSGRQRRRRRDRGCQGCCRIQGFICVISFLFGSFLVLSCGSCSCHQAFLLLRRTDCRPTSTGVAPLPLLLFKRKVRRCTRGKERGTAGKGGCRGDGPLELPCPSNGVLAGNVTRGGRRFKHDQGDKFSRRELDHSIFEQEEIDLGVPVKRLCEEEGRETGMDRRWADTKPKKAGQEGEKGGRDEISGTDL